MKKERMVKTFREFVIEGLVRMSVATKMSASNRTLLNGAVALLTDDGKAEASKSEIQRSRSFLSTGSTS